MPNRTTKTTTGHAEIQRWADQRDATPSVVKGVKGPGPGILRLDLPGYSGQDSLTPISWDEWFEKFDEAGLAFVYQDQTARGVPSNFNKLVSRESAGLRGSKGDSEAPRSRSVARRRKSASANRRPSSGTRRAPALASSAGRAKKKTAAAGRSASQKAAKKRA